MKYNIGASAETEYGKFFQWGDTVGYEDASHLTWSTAPFNNGASYYDATYFNEHKSEWLDDDVLKPEYDAAHVLMGGDWRMPTEADFNELTANTTVTWETNFNGSGINGRKFTSKTDASKYIFIPASGSAEDDSVYNRGTIGYVWSSSLHSSYSNSAWYLKFDSSSMGVRNYVRFGGLSVRGVVSK